MQPNAGQTLSFQKISGHFLQLITIVLFVLETPLPAKPPPLPKINSDQAVKTKVFNVLSFGAKGDGNFPNTAAIQTAIDAVAMGGGGQLLFPKGRFLTGSVILKSGVELCFQKNSVLLGSTNPADYRGLNRWKALILADGQTNISISGQGIIDGQGRQLALNIDSLFHSGALDPKDYNQRRKRPNENTRPQILEFVKCKNIRITGVTLKNSSCWVQTYDLCEEVLIDRIRVDSDAYWNNDGIDISDCKDVRITRCLVNSADDGICLKSHDPNHRNENIYIGDCTVRSSANALKLGTASAGGFKNIRIENIRVHDTFRAAIALESVDGGTLEDVHVDHLRASNTGNAIFIRLGHRDTTDKIGVLRNVTIKNVHVQIPFDRPDARYDLRGPEPGYFHNPFPCAIVGLPKRPVENVRLENIKISFPGRGNDGLAVLPLDRLKDVPEVESEYPEYSMFGELPAWGFYVRHVDGLKMKNVCLQARKKDFRPAIVFDEVKDLNLETVKTSKANDRSPVVLHHVIAKWIHNIIAPGFHGQLMQFVNE